MSRFQKLVVTAAAVVVLTALQATVAVSASSASSTITSASTTMLSGCSEGCTGGANCWAYAKCQSGGCYATVQNKTCRGTWVGGVD